MAIENAIKIDINMNSSSSKSYHLQKVPIAFTVMLFGFSGERLKRTSILDNCNVYYVVFYTVCNSYDMILYLFLYDTIKYLFDGFILSLTKYVYVPLTCDISW